MAGVIGECHPVERCACQRKPPAEDLSTVNQMPGVTDAWSLDEKQQPCIMWGVVDPWLYRLKERGDITRLARNTNISRASLYTRRKELGLPAFPRGAPKKAELTERQQLVQSLLAQGLTHAVIAAQLGVTVGAVRDSAARASSKAAMVAAQGCGTCRGSGLVPCGRQVCNGSGPHNHVCLDCGGNSTYAASVGLPPKDDHGGYNGF